MSPSYGRLVMDLSSKPHVSHGDLNLLAIGSLTAKTAEALFPKEREDGRDNDPAGPDPRDADGPDRRDP